MKTTFIAVAAYITTYVWMLKFLNINYTKLLWHATTTVDELHIWAQTRLWNALLWSFYLRLKALHILIRPESLVSITSCYDIINTSSLKNKKVVCRCTFGHNNLVKDIEIVFSKQLVLKYQYNDFTTVTFLCLSNTFCLI